MISVKPGSVTFQNVRKTFGAFTAIPDLSLTIEPGTLVTLLGPSGCGKTTTLRMLAGLEHPTSGRILIGDKDVTMLPANERDVSMVFQSYALFPHMTALDNVAYGLQSSGLRKAEAREKAEEGLKLVGLAGMGHRLPAELSGGQQQRVAVARALVLEPQVLLLDEPLSNLDARLRRRVRTEIRELQQRLGFTAVYVTHDQDEALAVSDRIIVMKDGEIAQSGAPRDLYEAPASAFIADFMGEANVVGCEVISIEGPDALIRVGGIDHRVSARNARPGPAKLAVRPGSIAIGQPGGQGVAGRVLHSAYLGGHVEYEVETDIGTLFIVDHAVETSLPPQSDVTLGFKNRGIALIQS
ncbi:MULTISPECIES: ABC transporter ATP-binding protein [Rhizobium/Agrobacterium group]|uniref:Spermidine/putrescine import ATP-binding protein PotA n=2 Tax=Rhizobium/Agrobacterium group TaxID=227290 RepID=A0AAN2A8E0_RHIRH|nr:MULTISPECIES: ABC transporter ATP-binding protein [Rhizobium/Agrobacterium group]AQS63479.1 ABC transporter ATP-binding protein [Rhizobium rhizogenes]MCZ7441246.1 ABC transporter ATP-binding protein [Rhizobium rhizogenes]MCZ7470200.1 ABC transporter ATP-binding protein [Rhizobium rhizogenes]MCZ7482680.1 ABC transporter ATP-binding protein [Rhizobium rhizogenes]MCZ7485984.1 ABC transporter ATP-binding protein [Rhizobium rhizogenes]